MQVVQAITARQYMLIQFVYNNNLCKTVHWLFELSAVYVIVCYCPSTAQKERLITQGPHW